MYMKECSIRMFMRNIIAMNKENRETIFRRHPPHSTQEEVFQV